jgi:hypothetical protein
MRQKLYAGFITVFFLAMAGTVSADWGTITSDLTNSNAYFKYVTLENSLWKIKYAWEGYGGVDNGTDIEEMILKEDTNFNLAGGGWIDGSAGRGFISGATIIRDTGDRKTVSLTWASGSQANVTMYKDLKLLKVQFASNGANIGYVYTTGGKNHYVYGSETWKRPLTYTYPSRCYFHRSNWSCPAANGETTSDDDPTTLLYHNHFIMGVFNPGGHGYGRVMPSALNVIKLLAFNDGTRGFEILGSSGQGYTGYLYAVTGGQDEMASMGKEIADWANNGEKGLPGDITALKYNRSVLTPKGELLIQLKGTELILGSKAGWATVEIYSLSGRQIVSAMTANDGRAHLDRPLMKGLYMVRVNTGNTVTKTKIIVP